MRDDLPLASAIIPSFYEGEWAWPTSFYQNSAMLFKQHKRNVVTPTIVRLSSCLR